MVTQTRTDIAGVELPELEEALHDSAIRVFTPGRSSMDPQARRQRVRADERSRAASCARRSRPHFEIDTPRWSAASNRPTAPPSSCSRLADGKHIETVFPKSRDTADATA